MTKGIKNKSRKIIFSLLFATAIGTAQNSLKIVSGGFGHFIGGPAYTDVSFAENQINSENRSQEAYDLENVGWLYGGEGFRLKNQWFYGGGGFAMYLRSAETSIGSINFGMGGGYFKAGYLVQRKSRSFSYFFGSIGGGELALTIKNRSEQDIILNEQTHVSPNTTNKYKSGAVFFDAGFGSKFLVTPVAEDATKCGGLILGFDIGCKISTPVGNWQLKGKDVNISARPTLFMPYVRVTIGGGIFNRE